MSFDIIVIGSGPAGYASSVYATRAGLRTLILEGHTPGGLLMQTTEIENYPGFEKGIGGIDLMLQMKKQCKRLGTTMVEQDATQIILAANPGEFHQVVTVKMTYLTKAVIIATGANPKMLDIPNGDYFWSNGISACAVCDGALPCYRNQPLAVVGGGDSACTEALHLSKFGSMVYLLVRGEKMRASHIMQQRVLETPNIQIRYRTEVTAAYGTIGSERGLQKIAIRENGKMNLLIVAGMFYAIGHTPNTAFVPPEILKDELGYILTDHTKTNIEGIFAAGDCQDRIYRQAITAAGSGCMAALEAERYLTHDFPAFPSPTSSSEMSSSQPVRVGPSMVSIDLEDKLVSTWDDEPFEDSEILEAISTLESLRSSSPAHPCD